MDIKSTDIGNAASDLSKVREITAPSVLWQGLESDDTMGN